MKSFAIFLILFGVVFSINLKADVTNPASLKIKEITPSNFEIVFTLPLINGRVLKAKPIFPNVFIVQGDVNERGIVGSVVRTWNAKCNPEDLVGAPIGVSGLLGTSQQIQLTIETLDGRIYSEVLLPTRSYFVVPPPPPFFNLVVESGIKGMELIFNRLELLILIMLLVFLKLRVREVVWGIIAFAIAQSIGQWLASQFWIVMSLYLPIALTALTSAFIAYENIKSESELKIGWHNPLWIVMLLIGLIYGAAQPQTELMIGLSFTENYIVSVFTAAGTVIGFIILMLIAKEFRILTKVFLKYRSEKIIYSICYVLGILSAAIFIYEMSSLLFIVSSEPAVPLFVFITIVVLGVWSKLKLESIGISFAILALVFAIAGIVLSFNGVSLPLATFIVYGFLAFLGITILIKTKLPNWLILIVLGTALFYSGNFVGHLLQNNSPLPVANSVGMISLLVFTFYIIYRLAPAKFNSSSSKTSIIVFGAVAVGLAFLWRFLEYGDWFKVEIASELAMGFFPLPLIAIILFGTAILLWPRKRAFKLGEGSNKEIRHWVILLLAFFTLPLGTIKINNPFSSPGAPSSLEATYILEKLLSDTYLAFNLENENDAFDRLEANLADDLIADVYLDSRRRLSAGTRQGATITVKDVSVMKVDSLKSHRKTERSYTYPCKWIVTARVKHLKHIHDRQNIYFGDLTIRVEDEKWKITKLVLKKEEREILPWKSSL